MTVRIGTNIIAGQGSLLATIEEAGLVRPDGSTILVAEDGTISVPIASSSALGLVKVDGKTITISNGILSASGLSSSIVETYVNGASWYRLWSDGWIEQGGTTSAGSITYLKSFRDTNYTLTIGDIRGGSSGTYFHVTGRSATGFTARYDSGHSKSWYACGY